MKLSIFLLLTIFLNTNTFAQLSGASIFPEMKVSNPAVLSGRPSAVLSFIGKKDIVEKEQDLSTGSFGAGTTSKSTVNVQTLSGFYGGKGSSFTSEISFDVGSGTKVSELSRPSGDDSTDNEVSQTLLKYAFNIGNNFGVSLMSIDYDYTSKFNFSGFSQNIKSNTKAQFITAGFLFDLGLDFGLYYESGTMKTSSDVGGVDESSTSSSNRAGIGLGKKLKDLHIEFGYEKNLKEDEFAGEKFAPAKISLTAEVRFGSFAIGYTGASYIDGFTDFNQLLFNDLVYSESRDGNRLEHIVNFSFGSEKGHFFSGSIGSSKTTTKEVNSVLYDGNKYDTEVTSSGVSLKYGYAF